MQLPASAVDLVRRAITLSSPGPEELGRPNIDEPFVIRGLDESGVSFLGDEAVRAFRESVDALAQSALAHGGWHEEAVETIVVEACRIGRARGPDAAIAHVEQALNSDLKMWRVGERIRAHVFGRQHEDPHVVGRCFLSKHAAFWLDLPDKVGPQALLLDYTPAVLVTEVQAHDKTSARWRAAEFFAETRAILLLASGSTEYGSLRPHFVRTDTGEWTEISGSQDPTLIVRLVRADGSLWPGYQQLAQAAAKPLGERTDWETRTLGAARWYQHALLDTWPAASLVAAMSAIEAIFCFPGERLRKHRRIAARLARYQPHVRGIPDDDVVKWFVSLYGRWRNNAIHDARFYDDERDVERLIDLTDSAVRWAISHLDPDHNPGRDGPCETIGEAHDDHDNPGRTRSGDR